MDRQEAEGVREELARRHDLDVLLDLILVDLPAADKNPRPILDKIAERARTVRASLSTPTEGEKRHG